MGRGQGRNNGGKGTGNKKHKWYMQNRQRELVNSMGKGEAKEVICMTHGHELKVGECWCEEGARWRGIKGKKNGTTVIT